MNKEGAKTLIFYAFWIMVLLVLVSVLDAKGEDYEEHPNQDVYEPGGR